MMKKQDLPVSLKADKNDLLLRDRPDRSPTWCILSKRIEFRQVIEASKSKDIATIVSKKS